MFRWWLFREIIPALIYFSIEAAAFLRFYIWARIILFIRSLRLRRKLAFFLHFFDYLRTPELWDPPLARRGELRGRWRLVFLFGLLSDLSTGFQRGVARVLYFLLHLHYLALLPPLWHLVLRPALICSLFLRRWILHLRRRVGTSWQRNPIWWGVQFLLLLLLAGLAVRQIVLFLDPTVHHAVSPLHSEWAPHLLLRESPRSRVQFASVEGGVGLRLVLLSQLLTLSLLLLSFSAAIPLLWKRWKANPPTHPLWTKTFLYIPTRVRGYQPLFGGLSLLALILIPFYTTCILWKPWKTWPFSLYYHPYFWIRGFWVLAVLVGVYGIWYTLVPSGARRWYWKTYTNRVKWGRWTQGSYQYDPILQLYFPMEFDSKRYMEQMGRDRVAAKHYFTVPAEHYAGVRVEPLEDKVSLAASFHVGFRAWRFELQKWMCHDKKYGEYTVGWFTRPSINFYHWRYEYITLPPERDEEAFAEKELRMKEKKWAAQLAGTWDYDKEERDKAFSEYMREQWDRWWRQETPWDYNFWNYYKLIEKRDPPEPEFNDDFSSRFLHYNPDEHLEGVGEHARFIIPHYDKNYHHPVFRYNRRYV